jgi:hypothetical protein
MYHNFAEYRPAVSLLFCCIILKIHYLLPKNGHFLRIVTKMHAVPIHPWRKTVNVKYNLKRQINLTISLVLYHLNLVCSDYKHVLSEPLLFFYCVILGRPGTLETGRVSLLCSTRICSWLPCNHILNSTSNIWSKLCMNNVHWKANELSSLRIIIYQRCFASLWPILPREEHVIPVTIQKLFVQ